MVSVLESCNGIDSQSIFLSLSSNFECTESIKYGRKKYKDRFTGVGVGVIVGDGCSW